MLILGYAPEDDFLYKDVRSLKYFLPIKLIICCCNFLVHEKRER